MTAGKALLPASADGALALFFLLLLVFFAADTLRALQDSYHVEKKRRRTAELVSLIRADAVHVDAAHFSGRAGPGHDINKQN